MNKEDKENIIYRTKASYDFEKVDIFLRVKGRLPTKKGDGLTQEILDEYCKKYKNNELVEGIVPLEHMYGLIKRGYIIFKNKNE